MPPRLEKPIPRRKENFFTAAFTSEWVVMVAISLSSLVLFLLDFDFLSLNPFLKTLDFFFLVFFVLEMGVKLWVYGWREFWRFGWNRFDFVIVMLSLPSLLEFVIPLPDFSFVLIFRILRVTRIFRFLRFIPNIHKLISGLKRSLKASLFVLAALFVYNFLLAVLTCNLFKEADPAHFGNPLTSFYTIFTIFTIEGWTLIPEQIAQNTSPWMGIFARLYFIGVVLTGGIFGFSIVNAIFVDEMVLDNTDELEAKIDLLTEEIRDLKRKMDE